MKFFFLIFLCLLSLPGLCQEEDDKLLEDLEADRKKQVEAALKVNEAKDATEKSLEEATNELKKLGVETITAASMMNEKVVRAVQKMMVHSPFKKTPKEEVKKLLLERNKDSLFGKFLVKYPKFLDLFVDLLKDKEALPSAVGLFLRKSDLKIYFFIWLCFMIESYLLKRLLLNPRWNWWNYRFSSFAISAGASIGSILTFLHIFDKELGPALNIVLDHWNRS